MAPKNPMYYDDLEKGMLTPPDKQDLPLDIKLGFIKKIY